MEPPAGIDKNNLKNNLFCLAKWQKMKKLNEN